MTSADEQALVQRLMKGEGKAFESLYRMMNQKLLKMARGHTKSEADAKEVVQDTWMSVVDSLPLYAGKSTLSTYVVGILRHEVADYWRRQYAKRMIRTVPLVDRVYREPLFDVTTTGDVIEKVYEKLKPHQVMLLRWKYEQGMSVKEMAEKMLIGVKAAEARLFRARQAFCLVYVELYGER